MKFLYKIIDFLKPLPLGLASVEKEEFGWTAEYKGYKIDTLEECDNLFSVHVQKIGDNFVNIYRKYLWNKSSAENHRFLLKLGMQQVDNPPKPKKYLSKNRYFDCNEEWPIPSHWNGISTEAYRDRYNPCVMPGWEMMGPPEDDP